MNGERTVCLLKKNDLASFVVMNIFQTLKAAILPKRITLKTAVTSADFTE